MVIKSQITAVFARYSAYPAVQAKIIADPSPISVKVTAKANRHLLENWEAADDLKSMRQCLRMKVELHPELKANLQATGDRLIVEDCTARQKGDAFFWGMALIHGQWVGENWMGRL